MSRTIDYDDGHAEALLSELGAMPSEDPRREDIRSELVRMHLPIARGIARRYAQYDEPMEDIQQAAMLGLVKAINRYDATRGERFLAYAAPTMTGEVKRHFRDRTWLLRIPRRLQELRLAMRAAGRDFFRENDRAPTVPEIARILGIEEEEAIEVIGTFDAYRPRSLDMPMGDDEDAETYGDMLGETDGALEDVVDHVAVRPMLERLPERERTILLYRFYGNKTQTEIAELMNLSQMHVSRLISRTLARLQDELLRDA
ncbi:SigB/SigF/SigG family RNA polymerase sigma factor [Actinomadura sp. DC4]|uniref:SigB/SigF/SigG family RNA polymerase sigma factor n=1 Tax=Actinomadura sp. DC4 TaxID=3055069 RepID=UPI0025B1D1D2|nr:SigB/SigF/SigG family RNA polymerase sigma factor [Actinomadura sp. DC4]MDN3354074.1 SigB/SigF/SigG family RNA polymerase sigma factor [Actinomadura sp. DC4]